MLKGLAIFKNTFLEHLKPYREHQTKYGAIPMPTITAKDQALLPWSCAFRLHGRLSCASFQFNRLRSSQTNWQHLGAQHTFFRVQLTRRYSMSVCFINSALLSHVEADPKPFSKRSQSPLMSGRFELQSWRLIT